MYQFQADVVCVGFARLTKPLPFTNAFILPLEGPVQILSESILGLGRWGGRLTKGPLEPEVTGSLVLLIIS